MFLVDPWASYGSTDPSYGSADPYPFTKRKNGKFAKLLGVPTILLGVRSSALDCLRYLCLSKVKHWDGSNPNFNPEMQNNNFVDSPNRA